MLININYDKDGEIISFQGGDPAQNDCPKHCKTLTVDDQIVKFDALRMKVSDGQLVMKG